MFHLLESSLKIVVILNNRSYVGVDLYVGAGHDVAIAVGLDVAIAVGRDVAIAVGPVTFYFCAVS